MPGAGCQRRGRYCSRPVCGLISPEYDLNLGASVKTELIQRLHKSFEDCAHRRDGVEYWLARELQVLLGYMQWRNFEAVIEKAETACSKAGQSVTDHFAEVSKMVDIGSETKREVVDVELTRYACYLIAQNGDPKKDAIAFAMTYFAVQTRKQEVIEARIAGWERVHARLTPRSSSKTCAVNPASPRNTSRTIAMFESC